MFDVGVPELVMILVVALVVFGPGKLPEVGAALGKSIREFRRATQAVTSEVESITSLGAPASTRQPTGSEPVSAIATSPQPEAPTAMSAETKSA